MFVSVEGISRILDCSRPFAEQVAKQLPYVVIGKSRRYAREAVLKFAAGQMATQPQQEAQSDQK